MRPQKPRTTGEGDLFRARLDQIINMKHELVQLAAGIDGSGSIAKWRPFTATMVGLGSRPDRTHPVKAAELIVDSV